MKPPYRTCPDCGAHLDPQERCTCQNHDEVAQLKAALQQKSDMLQEQIRKCIRKDAEIRKLTAALQRATYGKQRPNRRKVNASEAADE